MTRRDSGKHSAIPASSNRKFNFNPEQMTNNLTVAAAITAILLWIVSLVFPTLEIPELVQGAIYALVNYVVGGFINLKPRDSVVE